MKHTVTQTAQFRRFVRAIREHTDASNVTIETIAMGLLHRLQHVAIVDCPCGDIGSLDDEDIAELIGWRGESQVIVDALVSTEWLDRCDVHRLVIRNWAEDAPTFVKGNLKKHGKNFAVSSRDQTEPNPTRPKGTQPDLTEPNLTGKVKPKAQPKVEPKQPAKEKPKQPTKQVAKQPAKQDEYDDIPF